MGLGRGGSQLSIGAPLRPAGAAPAAAQFLIFNPSALQRKRARAKDQSRDWSPCCSFQRSLPQGLPVWTPSMLLSAISAARLRVSSGILSFQIYKFDCEIFQSDLRLVWPSIPFNRKTSHVLSQARPDAPGALRNWTSGMSGCCESIGLLHLSNPQDPWFTTWTSSHISQLFEFILIC